MTGMFNLRMKNEPLFFPEFLSTPEATRRRALEDGEVGVRLCAHGVEEKDGCLTLKCRPDTLPCEAPRSIETNRGVSGKVDGNKPKTNKHEFVLIRQS